MTARADLAALLDAELDVPVYDVLHDSVEVPSVVIYPAGEWAVPGDASWCEAEWRFVATFLARRADLDGALDALERFVSAGITLTDLAAIGGTWERAGDVRVETIAGVDYVAGDVTYLIRQPRSSSP